MNRPGNRASNDDFVGHLFDIPTRSHLSHDLKLVPHRNTERRRHSSELSHCIDDMRNGKDIVFISHIVTPEFDGPFFVAALKAGPKIERAIRRHFKIWAIAERRHAPGAIMSRRAEESVGNL